MIDQPVWPDAVRGIGAMLRGQQIEGRTIRPVTIVESDLYTTDDLIVHLEKHRTTTGGIDRVTEVRITVYGPTVTGSDDMAEAIVASICDVDVETPDTEGAASFYFDAIEPREGPAPASVPADSAVFPSVAVVAVRARPMP